MKYLRVLILLVAGLVAGSQAALPPFELHEGDVVAFVGGTDMVRLQNDARLEAALSWKHRAAQPRFRDLAWDGDTVYHQSTVRERWRREAFGGWAAQLKKVGATVVIAQFGKIESLDGIGQVGKFAAAYGELLDVFSADGRRVVLLAPSPTGWKGGDTESFARYTAAVRALAGRRGIRFVPASDDDPTGALWRGLGLGEAPVAVVEAVREKHRLWYDYWRPANWKCLFGDDGKRIFSNASKGLPSFKEEWSTFPDLIAAAEANIYAGEPVVARPAPARTGSGEADIEDELAAFEVLDGYEVNLFADETHGIANPLSVRWDPDGRMFVACSDVYPQIEPGVMPDDKIILLRDTDADGRADQSSVFARGLNIPTGMEVGADGVYVGQNTELLFLDWAGGRRQLLSGFGNGDSHQTINSFVWGPAGDLWFCQGDGIESRVETPSGISSLYQAGVFRLRPRELRLDGLLDDFMGPGNPWGVAFDDFGQSFVVDGAGGISYLTPASIPVKRRLQLPRIGKPGGYCGVESIGGGEFLTGDYKKNQVSRFRVDEDGAGFSVEFLPPLLRSEHRNFRPIDVKVGPDGAIYIVDWYNPITCHQDDFYRHPDRDKTHGRIWRVSKRGAVVGSPPALRGAGRAGLISFLKSPKRWIRLKAKQVLVSQGMQEVPDEMRTWRGRDLFEAVGLLQMLGLEDREMLEILARSEDHRARAYAARAAGDWGEFDLLEVAARDVHPRVRMEAVLACTKFSHAGAILIAAEVAGRPRDRWIDYALAQAVHYLEPIWLPAFQRGELDFGERRRGLAGVLAYAGAEQLLAEIRQQLEAGELDGAAQLVLLRVLATAGDESDLLDLLELGALDAGLLRILAARDRPSSDVVEPLRHLLAEGDAPSQEAVLELLGHWRVTELEEEVLEVAMRPGLDEKLRASALDALGSFGSEEARALLRAVASRAGETRRGDAIAALVQTGLAEAAAIAARSLASEPSLADDGKIFDAFAGRRGGARMLADELGRHQVGTQPARQLRQAWISTGLVDEDLTRCLDSLAGIAPFAAEFGDELVAELVAAGREGDPIKGGELFRAGRAACAACHKVGDEGGAIGPDLSAVGTGVPAERIVIELMWPTKQVKDGYSLTRVTTRDGRVLQGYVREGQGDKVLRLREFDGDRINELPLGEIVDRASIGSLMPATARSLEREDLADLLAYLFSLGG